MDYQTAAFHVVSEIRKLNHKRIAKHLPYRDWYALEVSLSSTAMAYAASISIGPDWPGVIKAKLNRTIEGMNRAGHIFCPYDGYAIAESIFAEAALEADTDASLHNALRQEWPAESLDDATLLILAVRAGLPWWYAYLLRKSQQAGYNPPKPEIIRLKEHHTSIPSTFPSRQSRPHTKNAEWRVVADGQA